MDIQVGIVGGDQLGINRNSTPEAAFNSFLTVKCTALGGGGVDALKLCPVEAATTGSPFKLVARGLLITRVFKFLALVLNCYWIIPLAIFMICMQGS